MSTTNRTVPSKCLVCHAELSSPIVCQGCHRLYPVPREVDYFGLLGLERTYDLDPGLLEERFLALSRHVHPDYFSAAPDPVGQLSVRLSAELNEALKVLKDPVLRAGYLLETSGGDSVIDDRGVPAEILAEAMMLREEIEEAQTAGNDATLADLRRTVEEQRGVLLERIATLARKLPQAGPEDKTTLRRTLNAVRYFNNMLDLLWTD